jgi:hypothetical protein
MSRFERSLLYGVSLAVVAGVLASVLARTRDEVRPVVHAADIDENAPLDVLRRGISFAKGTCIEERDRAARLEMASVLFESMSMGVLQNAATHALKAFRDEREYAVKLDKSSVPGDRQLARDAFARSQEWRKVEQALRTLYMAEIQRLTKEVERNKARAKEARQRSQEWRATERALGKIFATEVQRLKRQAGAGTPAAR